MTVEMNEHDEPAQLDIAKLTIKLTETPKPLLDVNKLQFGANFSDHMAITSFHPASGWSPPEIKPYAPLTLDPSSSCFQYGGNVFEGLKAYLGPDGKARLFRPDMNMRRLERSVARLALPGYSLYIRPTIIATRPALGITASDHAILYILASPSAPFFQRPISLLAVTNAVRAWPGGTGGDKFSGNYSPGFLPQREAVARGYDQVLWLFGEKKWVTEGGAMNVFVVLRRADTGLDVITPPLDGTILPGVTRASCLALLSDPSFYPDTTLFPIERGFTIADLKRWSADDTLLEVLCVGTAVIVGAVHRIGFEGRDIEVPTYASEDPNGLGPVGRALRGRILAVQEGRETYKGWGVVCE
ncbi:aminotransferase [Butyriboletus roseoflavus]|nr:aminotransferase [Butyriboletus roseoflavus]